MYLGAMSGSTGFISSRSNVSRITRDAFTLASAESPNSSRTSALASALGGDAREARLHVAGPDPVLLARQVEGGTSRISSPS